MIKVPRNTFYLKQTVDEGVNISPDFKDLPLNTETTFVLSEGNTENAFVLSGSVPDYPTYGAGELDGAYLSLYCNDITSLQARQNPKILGYRLKPDVVINEGGYTLAHISGNTSLSEVGHLLNCYYVDPVNSVPYMSEEFEGNPSGFQESITRAGGGTVTKFSGPYIRQSDYMAMLLEDGAVFVQGGSEWKHHLASYQYGKEGKYVVRQDTNTDMGMADMGVNKGLEIHIIGAPFHDFKIVYGMDYNYADWYTRWRAGDLDSYRGKWWSLSKYGKYIRYMYQNDATNSFDNQAEASRSNTIFKDIYASRNYGNPYQSSQTDPLIFSNVDLSVEKALNGGQSMRMYHNWGYYGENPTIQDALDVSGNLNPQCAYASLYNIPMAPYPFDLGRATVNSELTSANFQNHINPNSVLGEIRLPINVSKLGEMLQINAVSGTSVDTLHSYFYNADIDPSGGGSTPYTKYEQTFLRSVVVTFSNYKPKLEHTTVDKFIGYGLDRFYTGETTENIVGGFVMARPSSQVQSIHSATYQAGGMSVWPLPVAQIGQANTAAGAPNLVATAAQRGLLSGGLHKINGQTGGGATYDFNLNNCDTLLWGVTRNATTSLANDSHMRVVNLPMNAWNTCRIFIDPDQRNNFGSTTKRPYSASGALNPTMSSYKETGVPMRVIFDTATETTQMVTMSGSTVISVSGALVNPSTTNLPFIDVFFPIGTGKDSATSGPTGGGDYTFREKPEWYPQYMTIWVQNFPWVKGAQDGSAEEIGRTFFYGDDDLYPSGSVMEAEVYVDSVQLFNFGPAINNLTSGDALGRVTFKPIDYLSPLQVQISGTSTQDYKNAWVGSYPVVVTGNVSTTLGSPDVTIVGDSILDTTMFDNCGEISIVDTSGDATIPAGTKISTVNGLYSFTMDDDADATVAVEKVVLTGVGVTRPPINRANLTNYNTGQFLVFGLDNKNYLPLGTSTTKAAGYIMCNNYVTANFEEAKSNPLLPRKTNHYSSLSDGGAIISFPHVGGWTPPTNKFLQTYGSQLYGGGNYNVGTLASPDADTASPGGNISGAVFQVQDAAVETVNSISTTTGATNTFASNDGWRQKGFMYVSVSGADGDNGVGYDEWSARENILISVKITQIAPVVNTDKFDENNMTYNQIQVSDVSSFNFLNEDETYIIYEMGAADYANTGSKTGLKMDSTNRPNSLTRVLSFTEELKYADDGITELITEPKLPNLWICPEKYWLSMMFDSPPTTINRNYTGFCTINETPTTASAPGLAALSGSTFNEYTYSYNVAALATGGTAGIYYRTWNLNPTDADQQTIENNLDYGFGVYDAELNPLGGNALQGDVEYQRFNYYNIGQIVEAENLEPTDSFPLLLYHGGDGTKNRQMEFFSDDYTTDLTKVPLMYWRFKDEPPVINNLTVMPAVDVLGEDTDLYSLSSDSLNSVKFTWDEGNADDIWYRMLMVDTNTNILDKYHKCILRIPLNETIEDLSAVPAFTAYNPLSGTSVALVEDSVVRSVVEGQGGYAAYVSGTDNDQITLTSTADWRGLQGLDEWTLVVHWTPAAASLGIRQNIIGQTDDYTASADNFTLWKGTDDRINCDMDGINLDSTTAVPCDGRTPVSIVITSHTASEGFPRHILYVNGVREDASTEYDIEFAGDNDFVIAPDYGAAAEGAQGMMEEVLIYNKAWDVVNSSKEYVYNTSNLAEFDGTSSLGDSNYTQSARLFAMDYHNFRGSSKRHLGMSTQVGWRTVTA